jgi:antitoxin component of MazEF toxin-antitoxin module
MDKNRLISKGNIKKISKVGNSRVIYLDKLLLDLIDMDAGDSFEIKILNDNLVLSPIRDKINRQVISGLDIASFILEKLKELNLENIDLSKANVSKDGTNIFISFGDNND